MTTPSLMLAAPQCAERCAAPQAAQQCGKPLKFLMFISNSPSRPSVVYAPSLPWRSDGFSSLVFVYTSTVSFIWFSKIKQDEESNIPCVFLCTAVMLSADCLFVYNRVRALSIPPQTADRTVFAIFACGFFLKMSYFAHMSAHKKLLQSPCVFSPCGLLGHILVPGHTVFAFTVAHL